MAKRDPQKTARNKIIKKMGEELKKLRPTVLEESEIHNEHSLHGMIGHKNEYFIDVKNDIIHSPDQYVTMWMNGLMKDIKAIPKPFRSEDNTVYRIYKLIKRQSSYRDYLYLFLKRTFLRNYDALTKTRPKAEESEIWIGQNNANYGILITPRFKNDSWENDNSEIRHFEKKYWSIGHVLSTGLVIPYSSDTITFNTVPEYLNFFKNVLVRNSGSKYELEIAKRYSEFVMNHKNPEDIPLLIPEYRYGGLDKKHKHRLDFTIIESQNLNKFGFELSPWSSHGTLVGTKGKNQKKINEEASENFEKEISKLRDYFKKFNIYTLIYSDSSLKKIDEVFDDMKKYLEPTSVGTQMKFHVYEDILNSDL